MTDLSLESLDQQLLKIQSAKDHLLRTRQLFEEFGSAELKTSDAKFDALIDALNADLKDAELKKAQQQAAALAQQKLRLEGELAQAQSELARLRQLSNEQGAAHAQALADLDAATRANLKASEDEAELLLVQLHQVQEEFESTYLKAQADKSASEQQLAQLNAQLQQEQSAKMAAVQNAEQLDERILQARRQLDALQKVQLRSDSALQAAQQESERLAAELEQAQAAKSATEQNAAQQAAKLMAELEKVRAAKAAAKQNATQQAAKLTAELKQTHAAKATAEQNAAQQAVKLTAELKQTHAAKAAAEQNAAQQAAKLTAELKQTHAAKATAEQNAAQLDDRVQQAQRQLDALQQVQSRSDSALQAAQQENERFMLQLHQVQEELTQHFLDKQKLQRECETLQQRWVRLERRLPGYLDYERIEPVAVDTVSDQPRVDWRVLNLTLAGQLHPELAFSTLLQDGQAGIVLDGIELFPRALRGPDAAKVIAQFRRFGSRQWSMVLAAASALEQFFAGKPAVAPQLSFDPVFWRQALLPLVAELRALPAVFRFDGVTLKRELIHTDYEHLWLVLEGASLGQQQWPKFELRLGAADIRPGRFSRHPKLEFPLIDGNTRPFDSWYEESHDEFGGKFELRFDLNRQLMDIGVWAKLSVDDRKLLLSVNGVLGQALQRLQTEQSPISRTWSDWQGLAAGIIATLHKLSEVGVQQQKALVQPVPAPVVAPVAPAVAPPVAPPVEAAVVNQAPAKKAVAKKPAVKKTATRKPAA